MPTGSRGATSRGRRCPSARGGRDAAADGVASTPRSPTAGVGAAAARRRDGRAPTACARRAVRRRPGACCDRDHGDRSRGCSRTWCEDGTGSTRRSPGYQVAGKTGTAKKLDAQRALHEPLRGLVHRVSSRRPDPRVVVAAIIDEPRTVYGGVAAAPVFQDVARYAIQRLGIEPAPPVALPPHVHAACHEPRRTGRVGSRVGGRCPFPAVALGDGGRGRGAEIRGDAGVTVADAAYDSPGRRARGAVLLRPRRARRRPRVRGRGGRARAPRALVVERWLDARRAAGPRRRRSARRWARCRAALFGRPAEAMTTVGITGTNGKTTIDVPARGDLRAAAGSRRGDRDDRRPGRRRAGRRWRARRRRRPDLQRLLARMRDGGRRRGRDGGVLARAGPAPRRRDRVRRRRVHEPHAGPPRLPRDDGVLLRGEGAPVHAAARARTASSTSTTRGGGGCSGPASIPVTTYARRARRRPARDRTSRPTPDGIAFRVDGHRRFGSRCCGRVQRLERARGAWRSPSSSASRPRTRRAAIASVRRRPRSDGAGRRGAGVPGGGGLRAHAG